MIDEDQTHACRICLDMTSHILSLADVRRHTLTLSPKLSHWGRMTSDIDTRSRTGRRRCMTSHIDARFQLVPCGHMTFHINVMSRLARMTSHIDAGFHPERIEVESVGTHPHRDVTNTSYHVIWLAECVRLCLISA